MRYTNFIDRHFNSAAELWDALSPTKTLFEAPNRIIYRGQAYSYWELIPTILRKGNKTPASVMWGQSVNADDQIYTELSLLEQFAKHCDQVGIRIPGDSPQFRQKALSTQNQDLYFKEPTKWPNPDLIEIMALAQHHGIPTRLLDWTRQPYIAAYFASSSSLADANSWKPDDKLAIWALNIESINLYPRINVRTVPGAVTPHLAAQSGLFTVHPHNGQRGKKFEIIGLENEFGTLPNTPLLRLTLPVEECVALYALCNKAGINAATIYRSTDGAGRAVMDYLNSQHVADRAQKMKCIAPIP